MPTLSRFVLGVDGPESSGEEPEVTDVGSVLEAKEKDDARRNCLSEDVVEFEGPALPLPED